MWRTGKWLVESYGHAAHPANWQVGDVHKVFVDKEGGIVNAEAPFTLLIGRRPPSGQKGPNPQFASSISQEARQRWGTRAPLQGDLYARITWFHGERRTQDVDNIPKRILDALTDIVFEDDKIIAQTLATAIDVQRDYVIGASTADDDLYQYLLQRLEAMERQDIDAPRHLLYVEVGQLDRQNAAFGPIDRSSP